jgi:hypothetical protein
MTDEVHMIRQGQAQHFTVYDNGVPNAILRCAPNDRNAVGRRPHTRRTLATEHLLFKTWRFAGQPRTDAHATISPVKNSKQYRMAVQFV